MKETLSAPSIQPIEIINNFPFDEMRNSFPPPFASEKEWLGFLTGSEHTVLCSKTATMVSQRFVQCSGALVRNRRTGLVTVIHESTWSAAAGLILAIQRKDDLDFITMQGATGLMHPHYLSWAHQGGNSRSGLEILDDFYQVDRNDPVFYPSIYNPETELPFLHVFGDHSRIKGLTEKEAQQLLVSILDRNLPDGKTNFCGAINLPISGGGGRWAVTYRLPENLIYIFESSVKKLFIYSGLP